MSNGWWTKERTKKGVGIAFVVVPVTILGVLPCVLYFVFGVSSRGTLGATMIAWLSFGAIVLAVVFYQMTMEGIDDHFKRKSRDK
jgi:hypothetical protein